MSETEQNDLGLAPDRGADGAPVRLAADELPDALKRDPIYRYIYLGGLAFYTLLFTVFLR
jgi:hypothetical protein